MSAATNILRALLTLAVLALLVAPAAADAAEPNWPENGRYYRCHYQWPAGGGGISIIHFESLPPNPIELPGENLLKYGRLLTKIGTEYNSDERVALAWKPNEFPDPDGGSNFELTLTDAGIQCKRFENFGDNFLKFYECSNGITQQCYRLWP